MPPTSEGKNLQLKKSFHLVFNLRKIWEKLRRSLKSGSFFFYLVVTSSEILWCKFLKIYQTYKLLHWDIVRNVKLKSRVIWRRCFLKTAFNWLSVSVYTIPERVKLVLCVVPSYTASAPTSWWWYRARAVSLHLCFLSLLFFYPQQHKNIL